MKIISWNVNGLRSVLKKDAVQPVLDLEPDFLCLQEIKTCPDTNQSDQFPQFEHKIFHNAQKKGYSGTSIFCNEAPISVVQDLPHSPNDHPLEGRVISAEFKKIYLVNIYVPNAKPDLARLDYRENFWDPDLRKHLSSLAETKPVVAVGDFNVAHQEIDLARPQPNRGKAGFTNQEREQFTHLLNAGFIDSFRHLHPNETSHYSWWSYRAGARARNIGWRIDYVLISKNLKKNLKTATIHDDILGSDHCPVSVVINL